MKFIYARITKFRKEQKLNRIGLARLMQVKIPTITAETIRNWENGRNKPSDEYFAALCKVLKKQAKEFYEW